MMVNTRSCTIKILVLVSTLFVGQFVSAQVATAPKGSEPTDSVVVARRARMRELASSYSFRIPNAAETVKLIEKPLFYWATPERQAIGGELYLWTMQGRPFASIGMWTYNDIRDSHELQSFAEIAFEASTSATTPNVSSNAKSAPWQPRTAGYIAPSKWCPGSLETVSPRSGNSSPGLPRYRPA